MRSSLRNRATLCFRQNDQKRNMIKWKKGFPNSQHRNLQKRSEKESLIMCHRRIKAWIGEDTWSIFERPLDCKEIKPVNPKGNQSWIFIGRTDAEAPVIWPPDVKSWLIGKDPDVGKNWRQEEKGTRDDELVGWHHRLMDMNFSK